jgi:hypothetical protein
MISKKKLVNWRDEPIYEIFFGFFPVKRKKHGVISFLETLVHKLKFNSGDGLFPAGKK